MINQSQNQSSNSGFGNYNSAPANPYFSAPTAPISSKKGTGNFPLFAVILTAITTAGLSVGITYLIMSRKTQAPIVSSEELPEVEDLNVKTVISTDGSESEEEVINALDSRVSSAESGSIEEFEAILTKVSFLFDYENYNEIKSTLDKIPLDNLSNYQLFQLYNNYASYYDAVGDSVSAESYRSRAADAEAKYISE